MAPVHYVLICEMGGLRLHTQAGVHLAKCLSVSSPGEHTDFPRRLVFLEHPSLSWGWNFRGNSTSPGTQDTEGQAPGARSLAAE